MRGKSILVAGVILASGAAVAPANAATVTYTNQAAFNAAASTTEYGFSFTATTSEAPSYTVGGVTFTAGALIGYNDAYGRPYLADNNNFNGGSNAGLVYTISTGSSALGLFLGSYNGAATFTYLVNGVAGSIAVPARDSTTFLGFTNTGGPLNIVFSVGASGTSNSELDVTHFLAGAAAVTSGVPEPATWSLIIAGFGAVGFAMRCRQQVSARVSLA